MKKYFFIFLAVCSVICCTDSVKNKQAIPEKEKKAKEIPFDSIFVTDTLHLKKNIAERFDTLYTGTTVFNDGSTFDIATPLSIGQPKDVSQTFLISENIHSAIKKHPLDSMGVVMKGKTYHPTIIGHIALKAIEDYKRTKSRKAKRIFFDQLKWIEKNFYETERYGFWIFPFNFPQYHLKSSWPSVFSQGLMLNVCLEAYKLTGKEKYAQMLEKALKAYLVPVEYGGFMRQWNKNELWLEEYPTIRPSRVLNGIIYGLEGVNNVCQDLDLELAKKIFDSGAETLKNHLEDYNTAYSSRYSLAQFKNHIALEKYHEGHVVQLLWMYRMTGEKAFKRYARIFLESDRYDFFELGARYYLKPKIKNIVASNTIDTVHHGEEHLNNQIWAYGKFWSSHKKTDLIIDFGEKEKNISAVTLYHVSEQSRDVNFTIYAYNEANNKWEYVEYFIPKTSKDKVVGYNETGGYETFIEHHNIVEPLNARKIKIVFEATNDNIIALREINFIFDRTDDLKHLIEVVDKRLRMGM